MAMSDLTLLLGDAKVVLASLEDSSVDALVTDPPSGIGFNGCEWDDDKGGRISWVSWLSGIARECLRVLKPGAHGLVWALPRTSHWTGQALEEAGFEIRDQISHLFGTGWPKNHDVSKAIDKRAGVTREVLGPNPNAIGRKTNKTGGKLIGGRTQDRASVDVLTVPATEDAKRWDGWGTALKPSREIWWLVRKPPEGTIADNVLEHSTGAILVGQEKWPTNAVLSHQPQCSEGSCVKGCPVSLLERQHPGSAEFFYCPKPSHHERFFYCQNCNAVFNTKDARHDESSIVQHPTPKSLALMRWLCRLVTPPGGLVLDPFMGSGSTGVAAISQGFGFLGIEKKPEFLEIAKFRLGDSEVTQRTEEALLRLSKQEDPGGILSLFGD